MQRNATADRAIGPADVGTLVSERPQSPDEAHSLPDSLWGPPESPYDQIGGPDLPETPETAHSVERAFGPPDPETWCEDEYGPPEEEWGAAAGAGLSERPGASEGPQKAGVGEGRVATPLDLIQEVNWGSDVNPLPSIGLEREKQPSEKSVQTLKRVGLRKRRARPVVRQLIEEGEDKRGNKMKRCGSWVKVREFLKTGNVRVAGGNYCNMPRLCCGCAKAYAAKVGIAYTDKTMQLLHEHDVIPMMVTLTVPNDQDLVAAVQNCTSSLQQFRQKRKDYRKGSIGWTEWARFIAAAWHIEIKRGKNSGLWHPHVHGIVLMPRGQLFDLGKLHEETSAITGGKGRPDVRVTKAGHELLKFQHDDVMGNCGIHRRIRETIKHDLLEVFKYPLKFSDMEPADVVHAWRVMRGRRMLFGWDGYYGCKVDRELNDLTVEEGLYLFHIYRWVEKTGRYHHARSDWGTIDSQQR